LIALREKNSEFPSFRDSKKEVCCRKGRGRQFAAKGSSSIYIQRRLPYRGERANRRKKYRRPYCGKKCKDETGKKIRISGRKGDMPGKPR